MEKSTTYLNNALTLASKTEHLDITINILLSAKRTVKMKKIHVISYQSEKLFPDDERDTMVKYRMDTVDKVCTFLDMYLNSGTKPNLKDVKKVVKYYTKLVLTPDSICNAEV